MGATDDGPSLQGLAHRLETLERENAELRRKVATLEGSESERDAEGASDSDEKVSRRALLGKAAAAAVAATAAGTLLTPREARAETFNSVVSVTTVDAGTNIFANGFVRGKTGLVGQINDSSTSAVDGTNFGSGPGVESTGGHNGVLGTARDGDGYGVEGEGDTGVHGHTIKTGYSGVYGLHQGTLGFGVVGDGTGTGGAGVMGRNAQGAGVEARNSRYGGKFEGSRAQLLMVPKSGTGRPTSGAHSKGEVYMDSAGALFVCTRGGTPGTWRKVTTTVA